MGIHDAAFARVEKNVADLIDLATGRLDDLEKRLNRLGAPSLGSGRNTDLAKEGAALAEFVRNGDESRFRNALEIGSDPSGGYLVNPALSAEIKRKLFDQSPIRRLARVVEIGTGDAFVEPIDDSDADAAWVSESQARPETSAGDIGLNRIPLNEMYALVKVTQRLFDDSQFNIAAWITSKLVDRFARLEGDAFINATGIHSPKGVLTYPTDSAGDSTRATQTYQYVPSGSASAITGDAIINLAYSLRAPYRQNATIVMSSDTGRRVRLLKDGSGQYLLVPGLALEQPDRLCGLPVRYDENIPNVASGALCMVVADWQRAYTIIERPGLKWLRDPYSAKPHVLLYATRRVGGQSSGDFDALKIMKVATS